MFVLVTFFFDECDHLKAVFTRLKYSKTSKVSLTQRFVTSSSYYHHLETDDTVRVILPFEDQTSADIVSKQLKNLSLKVHTIIQPVFVSRKIERELNVKETKKPIRISSVLFIVFTVTSVLRVM